MDAVVFIGIQASGKTAFYLRRFVRTHVRISLDMLKTRHREAILLHACITAKQPFVVDNTNPTVEERARYILPARDAGFRVTGYYFRAAIGASIARDAKRPETERLPAKAIAGTLRRLVLPTRDEGFDALFYVTIDAEGKYIVED